MLRKTLSKLLLFSLFLSQVATFSPATQADEPSSEKRKFLVTAYYSPLPNQSYYTTGSYEGDIKLNGRGTNGADGTPVFKGMLAAPKSYAFGTQVYIPGLGTGEVHDRGGAIIEGADYDRIDVWMGHGEEGLGRALNWGSRLVEGEVFFNPTTSPADFDYSWINSTVAGSVTNRLASLNAELEKNEKQEPEAKKLPQKPFSIGKEAFSAEFIGELAPINLKPNEHQQLTLTFKNIGKETWDKTTWLHVSDNEKQSQGQIVPLVQEKNFVAAHLNEDSVAPGEIGHFVIIAEAGLESGGLSFELTPVANGKYKMTMAQTVLQLNSTNIALSSQITDFKATAEMEPEEMQYIEVELENTGNTPWTPETIKSNILGGGMEISDITMPLETIAPGEKGRVGFYVKAPTEEGNYNIYFRASYYLDSQWIEIPGAVANLGVKVDQKNKKANLFTPLNSNHFQANLTSSNKLITNSESVKHKQEDKPFRVKLSHTANQATLTASSAFIIANELNQTLFSLKAGDKVEVKQLANGFQIESGTKLKKANIVRLIPQSDSGISEIVSMERHPEGKPYLNDNRFRGIIEMRVMNNLVVYINELPLEYYLRGLVEVSNTEPLEKQKVIAVLTRTYANYYMETSHRKFSGMPYDGSDNAQVFQRYLGYEAEMRSPNFVKAVKETEGIVVTYQDELIKTPYFNQSSGQTRSAKDVWGWEDTPYLTSVEDPWSKGLPMQGHGVGLSGVGASEQAEAGKTFDEIIKYYYRGVEIEKL